MKKKKPYLSLDAFGSKIGLTAWDKELIREKNRIIDIVKTARMKKGWSQAELARRMGTKQPAIARMEVGQVGDVSFDFLIRAALVLKIHLELVTAKAAA